jgi:DNA-binding SARP family transcriptional activator
MEFRILGPLEVDDRGRRLPLRGPRQRALLASLLLRAGEIVPEDRLLDEVWRGEPPPSGGAALRVRISQLRKALAAAGSPAALATRSPGYVLDVDPGQVDALRFERLLDEGRAALAAGDAAAAAATLREALGLWRGPPLPELADEPFAAGEIGRLEGLRLEAVEERIEADLQLGRHRELAAELEELASEHPFRERLCAQLMLALYRSGRQAEALAAYRAARTVHVEELGIEPTRRLQELEQAILRQDPSLDAPAPAAAGPVPANLPTEERKLATILVAAPAGCPDDSDPERSSALLERFRAAAAEEVESCGGRIETFAGDTLTVAFGVPAAQEDHTPRALHAALALQRRLAEEFGGALQLRAGVDTGEVLSGGRSGLSGSTVVEAARLQRAAAPGSIVVGARAIATARRAFEFGPPSAAAPGEWPGRPLLRALTVVDPRGLRRFVGRSDELESLRAAYRRVAADGRPRLVTVAGEAGVGKTRLVRELWDELAAVSPAPLRRTGRCSAYGPGTTYRPVADVVREQLDLLETDAPATVALKLGRHEILGLVLGREADAELHPLAAREALHAGCVAFLDELVASQPAVLLVEDLHWAQEPLLDLLERALDQVSGPLLVVGTARPELLEHHPAWGRRRNAETLWLEPLPDGEAHLLLDDLCGDDVPQHVRSLLVQRAEGNAFFLEELQASLATTADGAEATPRIPDTVHAVLAARIDRLPATEKAALQAAAVIGRVFWQGPVRELLDGAAPDFAMLEARDFVRRRLRSAIADEQELTFRHALTREVAYAGVPKARRARLHAAFAAWLERVGEGRSEHAALLAHHYAEAVRPEDADLTWIGEEAELERLRAKAVTWLARAAELAIGRYELGEALGMLRRALDLGPEPLTELGLWRATGRANALRHDGEPFLAAMTRAIELAPDPATAGDLYAELSFEAALRAGMWRRRPERELVDGWIDRALELAGPESPARARALIARCVWAPLGSAGAAREASALAERLGDPDLRSYAWDARAITLWVGGEHDLGRALEERRFELLDQISDPDHIADIHYAPVTGCIWLGYFEEARRLARRHDEITSVLTPHHRIHGVAVRVEVEELVGTWESIRAMEPRAEETILGNLDTPCVRSPRSLLVCALAAARLGDHARAAQLEAAAEEFRMEGYGHVLDTPRLRLALLRDDLGRVEELVADPLPDRGWHRAWLLLSTQSARLDALARLGCRDEIEAWEPPRPGTYLEPFHLRALGTVRDDATLLERSLAAFERLRLGRQAAETRTVLA